MQFRKKGSLTYWDLMLIQINRSKWGCHSQLVTKKTNMIKLLLLYIIIFLEVKKQIRTSPRIYLAIHKYSLLEDNINSVLKVLCYIFSREFYLETLALHVTVLFVRIQSQWKLVVPFMEFIRSNNNNWTLLCSLVDDFYVIFSTGIRYSLYATVR